MEIIHKYFPHLSDKQIEQFQLLGKIYHDWNQKINLISRKDISQLYERHVLHSLSIVKLLPFRNPVEILDIGTGGGFPGIPLAIYYPESNFVLVDSTRKKIKVVNDIVRKTGLENCTALHERAENIPGQFDYIVSRAVSRFDKFADAFKKKVRSGENSGLQNGIIYLKGGNFEDEIRKFKNDVRLFSISDIFRENYFQTKKIIYLKIGGACYD